MTNDPAIVFWEASSCPSDQIVFIKNLEKQLKISIKRLIISTPDPSSLSSSCSDLPFIYDVSMRFGENAIHESIIDMITAATSMNGKFTAVIISNGVDLWISLFQRILPKKICIISPEDVRDIVDCAFLPPSVSIQILNWPSLSQVEGGKNEVEPKEEYTEVREEEEEVQEENVSDDQLFKEESPAKAPKIQPLNEAERRQSDIRSPIVTPIKSPESVATITSAQRASNEPFLVSKKFKPLIESMRAIGKAMIALSDLENQYKAVCNELGEDGGSLSAVISRASDAGIVIFDRSINYVRFRNRAMSTSPVQYE